MQISSKACLNMLCRNDWTCCNDLSGGLISDRIMKSVLHGCVKALCDLGSFVIVNTALSKKIGDLLPNPALARTDRAKSF